MNRMIEIQGDILEGGGQILRNSCAYSCILQKPIRIQRIRAKRSQPGLRPQHLCGFQLLAQMAQAQMVGDEVGSTQVSLSPGGAVIGNTYKKEVGTAGSLVLLLQSALPVAIFAGGITRLELGGGTNAEMAPPIDYFQEVFLPMVSRMGVQCDCSLEKRGFYPKGGGKVAIDVKPVKVLKPITLLERGEIVKITGLAYCSGQVHINIAKKMSRQARSILEANLPGDIPINIQEQYLTADKAVATGCGLFLKAETSTGCLFGGTGFGRKGKSAEVVGKDAADELLKSIWEYGCLDEHLQDQLIIFMALAPGLSQIRSGPLTLHTQTAIHIAELMTGVKFEVKNEEDGTFIISCDGLGYRNQKT